MITLFVYGVLVFVFNIVFGVLKLTLAIVKCVFSFAVFPFVLVALFIKGLVKLGLIAIFGAFAYYFFKELFKETSIND